MNCVCTVYVYVQTNNNVDEVLWIYEIWGWLDCMLQSSFYADELKRTVAFYYYVL